MLRSRYTVLLSVLLTGTALAQNTAPPQVQVFSWVVNGTTLMVDPSEYIHQEGDTVTVTLRITDPDWTPPDPNNPGGGENETVYYRFLAFGNDLIAPPSGPPIEGALEEFVPEDGISPTGTELFVSITFNVPLFLGRNQQRLRGIIDYDVEWFLEFAVSNEQDPEVPICGGPDVNCDFTFLRAVENPALSEPNPPPVADAGPDQTVLPNTVVTLDGSRTIDLTNIGFDPADPDVLDKDNITFAWEFISGPIRIDPTQTEPNDPTATVTLPQLGAYTYRLLVSDNGANSLPTTDSVVVNVVNELPENRAPRVVITGPANAVIEGTTVALDASATSDPDGDTLTYTWQQTDELGGTLPPDDFRAVFQPVGGSQTNKIAWQANQVGVFYFRLVVTDGEFISSARFEVEVIDRETAGYSEVAPRPADDAGDVSAPGNAAGDDVGPLLAPLCGAGLLPLSAVPLALLLMRRRW